MGAHGGPNMTEDGVVFYYDTGNSKSYAGEPTTNLATLDLSNTSVWYSESGDATKELQSETLFGYPVYRIQSKPGEIWRTPAAFNGYDKANGPITLSVYARNLGATATLATYLSGDYSTDSLGSTNYKNVPTDGIWRKYSWTRTAADMNTTNQLEFRTSGDNMQISCPQVEHKLHPTPIVEGTRSANEGLKDLTNSTTLDLSTAGFNANAELDFDGTNDYVGLENVPLSAGASTYSIEAVFRADSTKTQVIWEQNSSGVTQHQRACLILLSGGTGGFNGQANDFHSVLPYSTGTWYHWVVTIDKNAGSNPIKAYSNGVLVSEGDSSAGAANLNVGTHGAAVGYKLNSNGEYFDGEIKMVKVYDRALTAEEVAENFNGIRSRFGI